MKLIAKLGRELWCDMEPGTREVKNWEYVHWVNHSPTGFSWGYNGSGPSQMAWVMCFLFLEHWYPTLEKKHLVGMAEKAHVRFRFDVVAKAPMYASWEYTLDQFKAWYMMQSFFEET